MGRAVRRWGVWDIFFCYVTFMGINARLTSVTGRTVHVLGSFLLPCHLFIYLNVNPYSCGLQRFHRLQAYPSFVPWLMSCDKKSVVPRYPCNSFSLSPDLRPSNPGIYLHEPRS